MRASLDVVGGLLSFGIITALVCANRARIIWTSTGGVPMPVYDYLCKDCNKTFERVLTLHEHDSEQMRCPKCGGKNIEQQAAAFYAVTSKKSA